MPAVSMKALLESGVHFGHRTNKWNPKMRPYIFTERNGIHIIDLQQTVKLLDDAFNKVRDTVAAGGSILFVGTKRQAQETIQEEAERCGMPYVNQRWLGGTLTNWVTIQQRIIELTRLEKLFETGEINQLTKKEGLLIQRDITRLQTRLSGVRNMKTLPDLLFIIDVGKEDLAILEARDLLFARLLQYRAFAQVADELGRAWAASARAFPRVVPLDPEFAALLPEIEIAVGTERFARIAARALSPKPAPPTGMAT